MRPTGASIVDHVLGGYPPGLPLVIEGASGSGRTVLSLQLASAALARGERVQFVASEPAPSLMHQAGALGFDFEDAARRGQLALLELDAAAPALVRAQGVAALVEALRGEAPDASLVIIDPFTAITAEILEEPKLREISRAFVRALPASALVLTVESERLAMQRGLDRVLSELCGAYLLLERETSGRRTLTVEKTRTGVGASECVELAIGPGGTHLVGDALPLAAIDGAAPGDDVALADWVGPAAATSAPSAAARAAPARAASAPAAAAAAPASKRPTILVVDDTRLQRELIRDWLSDRYEVVCAADGFEALSLLLSQQPDLVVLDLIMPRVTGYELLCALRRSGLEVPVLVSSSRVHSAGDRLGPLVLGATDFLAKPVNRLELEHKVDTLLHLRRSNDQRFDAAEAEALFGRVSATRLLEAAEFRERLARAHAFGERHDMPSSLIRITAPDAERLTRWIDVANQELRFEDAVLRTSKRHATLLLVATPPSEASKVVERLLAIYEQAGDAPHGFGVEVRPATPEPTDAEPPGLLGEPGSALAEEA